jgi:thiamine-monophosphate kinase
MNEFDCIKKFFNAQPIHRPDVILGIGDDAAIVKAPSQNLIITTDTLIEDVHFPKNTSAFDIGFKALAVNLSDLAAMGATPAWITLALTLPEINELWLEQFRKGLFALMQRYHVQLIGGDLTRGSLSITIQAHGFSPGNQAIRRDNAKMNDLIYVTHTLGDAALGLLCVTHQIDINPALADSVLTRLNRPEPQIEIGEKLRGIAHSAIDISDGLVADLTHILNRSNVGAIIHVDNIPLSTALRAAVPYHQALKLALTGGDDYELCFTIPAAKKELLDFPCTCIGEIIEAPELYLLHKDKSQYTDISIGGYKHF